MVGESKLTTDHEEIRRWAEERGGRPSRAKSRDILRIDFRDQDEDLEEVSWDEFFRIFDESDLAFLYEEETSEGADGRFNKFVSRTQAQATTR
jgi:hypothetical protein